MKVDRKDDTPVDDDTNHRTIDEEDPPFNNDNNDDNNDDKSTASSQLSMSDGSIQVSENPTKAVVKHHRTVSFGPNLLDDMNQKPKLNRVTTTASRNSRISRNSRKSRLSEASKAKGSFYNWRQYAPDGPNATWIQKLHWFITGDTKYSPQQTHDEYIIDLQCLVECLTLLRLYLQKFGLPKRGCHTDQDYVLREITCDLYSGGTPLWALESIMQRVTVGLTGNSNVTWCFLPRRALVYHSNNNIISSSNNRNSKNYNNNNLTTTSMYKIERGFCLHRLDAMEPVVVQLASFASNTSGVAILPNAQVTPTVDDLYNVSVQTYEEFPPCANGAVYQWNTESTDSLYKPTTFPIQYDKSCIVQKAEIDNNNKRTVNVISENKCYNTNNDSDNYCDDFDEMGEDELAREILDLAAETQGLFYYINSPAYAITLNTKIANKIDIKLWTVTQEERECFSRLACIEAMRSIIEIDETILKKPLYTYWMRMMFRFIGSVGVCLLYFGGSWIDIGIAGMLGLIVGFIAESSVLSKQEKIIIEAVACYTVGLSAGLIALEFPNHTCFVAMAIPAIVDLLQGFRLIFAIVEIMSRNTVAGAADFFESILYTGLIAYFLRFGQYTAGKILTTRLTEYSASTPIDAVDWSVCTRGVSWYWYPLFVPITALAWSGKFSPNYRSLIPMALHGVLSYTVNNLLYRAGMNTHMNSFISALLVSFAAGIVSRFTGQQAVGNTVAGLYALAPGAYLVQLLYDETLDITFFTHILTIAVSIAVGAWTGSLLCSPTLLGATRGIMSQQMSVQHLHDYLESNHDITNQQPTAKSPSSSTNSSSTSSNLRRRNGRTNSTKGHHTMLYF